MLTFVRDLYIIKLQRGQTKTLIVNPVGETYYRENLCLYKYAIREKDKEKKGEKKGDFLTLMYYENLYYNTYYHLSP